MKIQNSLLLIALAIPSVATIQSCDGTHKNPNYYQKVVTHTEPSPEYIAKITKENADNTRVAQIDARMLELRNLNNSDEEKTLRLERESIRPRSIAKDTRNSDQRRSDLRHISMYGNLR